MDKEIEKEFKMIRTEFSSYKTDFNNKLDAFDAKLDILFDEIRKPLFTIMQILGFIGITILYTYYITNAFSKVEDKGDGLQKQVDEQKLQIKEDRKLTTEKLDKIYEIVADTRTDVAILKEKKSEVRGEEISRKKQIEKNKQIIRDWAAIN